MLEAVFSLHNSLNNDHDRTVKKEKKKGSRKIQATLVKEFNMSLCGHNHNEHTRNLFLFTLLTSMKLKTDQSLNSMNLPISGII